MNDQIKAELDYFFADEALVRNLLTGFHLAEVSEGISAAKDVPLEIAAAPAAFAQWVALSDADAVDVENYMVSQYGSTPDTADQDIEKIFNTLISIHGLFGIFNQLVALFHKAPVAPVVPPAA